MQSQVAAQVSGVVKSVYRQVGDWVKEGETVIQLDDSQLRLTLASAQASLENTKINLAVGQDTSSQANPKLELQLQSAQAAYEAARKYAESQKALFDMGGISASQLDTANSQLSTAQANLEGAKASLSQNNNADAQSIAQLKLAVRQSQNTMDQAQLNLRNTSIRAPFAGQIAAINLQPGMYASLNTQAFTLVSVDRRISFNVSPSDAPFLKAGAKVTFFISGRNYSATIRQEPSMPISGVVPLTATVDKAIFPYGSVGDVKYRVPLAKGIIIPISALAALENRTYVFAVEGDRVATKDVTVISETGTLAAVLGLNEGDLVVLSPPPGLLPGSKVEVTQVGIDGKYLDTAESAAPHNGARPYADKAPQPNAHADGNGAQASPKRNPGPTAGQRSHSWNGPRPSPAVSGS
jgi:multidrug efflux pump subunit AcrA (membrane-fusion protein)